VTVVGAGPAGLACAIALARRGRRVVVREWHDTVGHRFHGDFQGLENWTGSDDALEELRAAEIEPSFEHHPVYEGIAFDASGRSYHVRSKRPIYYLIRRGSGKGTLDHGLLQQALDAGVEVRFADRAERSAGETVLAGGPRSADAIAVGYVFDTDAPDGNWVAFDDALAPLGYGYLLIHGGRGTVASCMFTGFKRQGEHLARTVEFFRERCGLKMRNERRFGGFANLRLARTAVQGGHPVIGEQAGFQDALAGFGMRYAFRSGLLAARSIVEGTSYAKLWRESLLPWLRAGVVDRFLFNIAGVRGRRIVLDRLSRADAREALGRLYRRSLFTRILFPLAWLRYRAPLADPSCDHIDCGCVWCECGAEANAQGGAPSVIGGGHAWG